ncbi:MAG: hypothetical protein WD770_07405 [Actinomycetota bacterium]
MAWRVSDIRHMTPEGWKPSRDSEGQRYKSFADFADPDGNTWILQERRLDAVVNTSG